MPSVLRIPGLVVASLAAALCVLVVGVAVSDAKIVPQKSIAGAKMGMTQKRVLTKLGEPDRTRIENNPFSGLDYIKLKYGRTWVSFNGVLDTSEVWGISTKDPDERTASGVGVGSTKAEVKAGVDGVKCEREFGINHCYVGEFHPFEIVTNFSLKKTKKNKKNKPWRVNRVAIGLVLD